MQDDKLRNITYKSHFWRYINAFMGTIAVVVGLVYVFFDDTDKTARVWNNLRGSAEQTQQRSPAKPPPNPVATLTTSGTPALAVASDAPIYQIGDRFDYRFSTARSGFISLWNITASGRAQRIIPVATNSRAQRAISGQEYRSGQHKLPTLRVSGRTGVEQLLLLWCAERSQHGYSALFHRAESLEQDLLKRRQSGCVERRSNYQIVATPSP